MHKAIALSILKALADGIDPFTKEILPPHNLYQQPQTIRALFVAIKALEDSIEQDQQQRRDVLQALSKGLLPEPKRRREGASVLNQEPVVEQSQQKKKVSSAPSNAGKSWNSIEDVDLLRAFDAGASIQELMEKHQRTRGAITARLMKHGRLQLQLEAQDTLLPENPQQEQPATISPDEVPF